MISAGTSGDRFTVLSDGQLISSRMACGPCPLSGDGHASRRAPLSVRGPSIEGPISSSLLYGSTSCRLSPKWIINYGSSLDLGSTGNIGQRGEIVRVGESFLVGLGFNYDASRDNFGVQLGIEPRFLSRRLGRIGGVPIPPVGVAGSGVASKSTDDGPGYKASGWSQKFLRAIRGLRVGSRGESSFFVHVPTACFVLAAAAQLRVTRARMVRARPMHRGGLDGRTVELCHGANGPGGDAAIRRTRA